VVVKARIISLDEISHKTLSLNPLSISFFCYRKRTGSGYSGFFFFYVVGFGWSWTMVLFPSGTKTQFELGRVFLFQIGLDL
jgi:hypothetical protein